MISSTTAVSVNNTSAVNAPNNEVNVLQDLPKITTERLNSLTKSRIAPTNKHLPTRNVKHLKKDSTTPKEPVSLKDKSITIETSKPTTETPKSNTIETSKPTTETPKSNTKTPKSTQETNSKTSTKEKVSKFAATLAVFAMVAATVTAVAIYLKPHVHTAKEKLTPLFDQAMKNFDKTMEVVKAKVEELILSSPIYVLVIGNKG
jgi:hypothetical protein